LLSFFQDECDKRQKIVTRVTNETITRQFYNPNARSNTKDYKAAIHNQKEVIP